MRKVVLGALVCVLLFSLILAGCNSGSTTATTTQPAPTTSTSTSVTKTAPPATSSTTTSAVTTTSLQTFTTTTTTAATTTTTTASTSADYPIPLVANVQRGGTMIFNHNASISFISAPADGSAITQRIARFVFEPLLICDVNENLQPWLATSWSTSPDGKAVTLKLRKGVKFSDGTDFNAEAVKFNLDLDLKNNINGSAVLKSVVSYDIPDPYTITLHLRLPCCCILLRALLD
jgi:ABC-type transport system substrate-binding protein